MACCVASTCLWLFFLRFSLLVDCCLRALCRRCLSDFSLKFAGDCFYISSSGKYTIFEIGSSLLIVLYVYRIYLVCVVSLVHFLSANKMSIDMKWEVEVYTIIYYYRDFSFMSCISLCIDIRCIISSWMTIDIASLSLTCYFFIWHVLFMFLFTLNTFSITFDLSVFRWSKASLQNGIYMGFVFISVVI